MAELSSEDVLEQLRTVVDPELGFSIVDLGLIREIVVSSEHVQIMMTLTTPACPYGPELIAATEQRAAEVTGKEAVINLVWSPPWNPRIDASDDVLAELGIWL